MTSVNCTCAKELIQDINRPDRLRVTKIDPYCPIHGRIRNMDAGASPFMSEESIIEIERDYARDLGIDHDEAVRAAHIGRMTGEIPPDPLVQKLRRDAAEADAAGTTKPFPKTREEFIQELEEQEDIKFYSPPEYDVDSDAEEI